MKPAYLIACAAGVLLAGPVGADPAKVTVVPGSSAAYLYFPAAGDSKSLLRVSKMGNFRRYAITYQIEDDAPIEFCSRDDEVCEISLPTSLVTLAIKGDFGKQAAILAADWNGDCAAKASAGCKLSVGSGDNQIVRVETACDGSAYSKTMAGSAEGLCIGLYQGSYLVAAHKDIVGGRKPKNVKATWGNTNTSDGRENMPVLLNNMASSSSSSSAHHCKGLSTGGFSDWYLPVVNELMAIGSKPSSEVYGTFYASNTKDAKNNYRVTYGSSGKSSSSSAYNSSSNYSTLCFRRVEPVL